MVLTVIILILAGCADIYQSTVLDSTGTVSLAVPSLTKDVQNGQKKTEQEEAPAVITIDENEWETYEVENHIVDLEVISANASNRILQQCIIGDKLYVQYYDNLPSTLSYLGQWNLKTGKQIKQIKLHCKTKFTVAADSLFVLEKSSIVEYDTDFNLIAQTPYDATLIEDRCTLPQLSCDGAKILFSNSDRLPVIYDPKQGETVVLDQIVLPDGQEATGLTTIHSTNLPDSYFLSASVTDETDTWYYTTLYDLSSKKSLNWFRRTYEEQPSRAVYCNSQNGRIYMQFANNSNSSISENGFVLKAQYGLMSDLFDLTYQLTVFDLTRERIYRTGFSCYSGSAEVMSVAVDENQSTITCIVSNYLNGEHVNRIVVLDI
ncbi:MAG: hypothetical protein ACERKO_10325 [Acetanaerobacterium sp.]